MSNRIKHDDILLLEQPFLKVPSDNLRSAFRSTQRLLERDFDKLNTSIREVGKSLSKQNVNSSEDQNSIESEEETIKAIDGLLLKARGLKRKISDTYDHPEHGTGQVLARIKARLDHLQDLYSAEHTTDPCYKTFSQTRLDRHVVDYMLRSGYTESAQSLSKTAGIEALVDAPLFAELARIEFALVAHSCTEALAWCKENAGPLKKMQSTLEFELRFQEFIELARNRRFIEALNYSSKQLLPWKQTHMSMIAQGKLYDPSRWSDLHASFRATVFAVHSIPDQPFLHLSLSVGLAALKLPACYSVSPRSEMMKNVEMLSSSLNLNRHHHSSSTSQNYDPSLLLNLNSPKPPQTLGSSQNPDCPVCDSNGLGVLAKECPWSHHLNSIIVCGSTGKVVEDGDRLAVLPNGRVYSRDGLERLAERDEGRIRCPKTGQVFGMDEIRRVFIS
ncbi:CTLH/CRA C-terminal to lish motif domain-containing protein [Melampsora americana]|nr:CTLH/CRA C-terminal to lish motif domain-containing protein [Melampsora americana]